MISKPAFAAKLPPILLLLAVVLLTSLVALASAKSTKKRGTRPGRVQTGLDVLAAQKFAPLKGKHIGLITNHTGQDALGRNTIDQLSRAPGVQLVALFSPEHGLA